MFLIINIINYLSKYLLITYHGSQVSFILVSSYHSLRDILYCFWSILCYFWLSWIFNPCNYLFYCKCFVRFMVFYFL